MSYILILFTGWQIVRPETWDGFVVGMIDDTAANEWRVEETPGNRRWKKKPRFQVRKIAQKDRFEERGTSSERKKKNYYYFAIVLESARGNTRKGGKNWVGAYGWNGQRQWRVRGAAKRRAQRVSAHIHTSRPGF